MPSEIHSSAGTDPSRRSWLVPAGTFLAGCALGAVVGLGVAGDDESDRPTAATQADQGTEPDGADGPAAGGDPGLYVRVPEVCVRTADDATTLVDQVDRIVEAVAELEPETLRQSVDDVQQIRDTVSDVAAQCRAEAARRLQDADAAPQASAAP